MDRELPTLMLGNDSFLVDTKNDLLRLEARTSQVIRFADMEDKGTHYALRYYPQTKNLVSYDKDSPYLDLKIRPLKEIDPEGMSRRYGISLKEMENKTDYDIIVREALVKKRLEGNLPTVDVEGHPFYVDLRMQSVRPHNDFTTQGITFDALKSYYTPDGSGFLFPYDPKKHEVAKIDFEKITEIPKNVMALWIPTMMELDSVGYARLFELDMKPFLRRYPPQEELKAARVPWEETGIKKAIAQNIKLRQEQTEGRKPQHRLRKDH